MRIYISIIVVICCVLLASISISEPLKSSQSESELKPILNLQSKKPKTVAEPSNPTIDSKQENGQNIIDWSQFVPTLLATGIGAGLGFLIGMLLNRMIEQRSEKAEILKKFQRGELVLNLVLDELMRNQEFLKEAKIALDSTDTTYYSASLDVWSSISQEVLEHVNRKETAKVIVDTYDRLQQFTRGLIIYTNLAIAGGESFRIARTQKLPELQKLIRLSLEFLETARSHIEKELKERAI